MNLTELFETCSFCEFTEEIVTHCQPFSCGNADLDDFFCHDSILYSKKLLGKCTNIIRISRYLLIIDYLLDISALSAFFR